MTTKVHHGFRGSGCLLFSSLLYTYAYAPSNTSDKHHISDTLYGSYAKLLLISQLWATKGKLQNPYLTQIVVHTG